MRKGRKAPLGAGNGIIARLSQLTLRPAMNVQIPAALAQEARRHLECPQLASFLQDLLRQLHPSIGADDIATDLHPACQMLSHSLRHHQDAGLAVSQYFAVALQQFHVVEQIIQRHPVARDELKFLDFACGYGRLLRFLVRSLPTAHIHAAEIMPEAVDHARRRYQVTALQSTERPKDFHSRQRYDVIWVASLFSHLPDELFTAWLRRLHDLLSDDGILCFTVHDQALLPSDMPLPESGLLYIEGSENEELSPSIYGTTFVSEAYVRTAVAKALGRESSIRRIPRLLAHEQDLYLVGRDGEAPPASMKSLRRGLRGWLDGCRIDADNTLHLHGWAGSMDGDPLDRVEVRVEDRSITCHACEPRPRVAEVLGKPELDHCGWSCSVPLRQANHGIYLTISAHGHQDPPALIYAGPVSSQGSGE